MVGLRVRAVAVAAVLATTGCGAVGDVFGGGDAVFDTGIEPAALEAEAPAYMALDGERTLLLRSGDHVRRLARADAVDWLPDGNALVRTGGQVRVADPARGLLGRGRRMWEDPSRAVTRLNSLDHPGSGELVDAETFVLRSYDLSLGLVEEVPLPPTDNPDATDYNELYRNYFGAVPTIDGVTFAKWHDGSEWYEDGDYGVLRMEGDEQENVLINADIVGLYLSADGTGLLGLRQSSGDPCGGCVVDQDIVEIDPATGEIAAEYGTPEPYDEDWRVGGIDKVGDRVAVRYYDAVQRRGGFVYDQLGTWVYDGEWSMLPGSDEELTWWQGEDRVVARVDPSERRRGDGFDLFWVHGDDETPLPGELGRLPHGVPMSGRVAGQYLPPT